MKNVRVKVREFTCTSDYDYGIYEGRKCLMCNPQRYVAPWGLTDTWRRESYAIKAAKAMAKKIGIKYDPEIIRQKGC